MPELASRAPVTSVVYLLSTKDTVEDAYCSVNGYIRLNRVSDGADLGYIASDYYDYNNGQYGYNVPDTADALVVKFNYTPSSTDQLQVHIPAVETAGAGYRFGAGES